MPGFVQNSFADEPAKGVEGGLARLGIVRVEPRVASARKQLSIALVAVNSHAYPLTINGTAFSYTSDGSATTAEVAAGLVAAINAGSEPVVAAGADTPITITAKFPADVASDFSDTTPANARLTGDFVYATADTNLTATTVSTQSQEIPVGMGVCMDDHDTLNQACRLPSVAADVTSFRFAGVVLDDVAKVAYSTGGRKIYHRTTMLPVLSDGFVWVKVEEAVLKGDQAFCRFASGSGGTQPGSFRKSSDSTTAAACARCFFETAAAAGELAALKVGR